MAGTVVVFDFDKTIIDVDSDNWVIDSFGATELFERLLPTMPWNTLMDTMMEELHRRGITIEQIADVLRIAPIDPIIVEAIKAAYKMGCDLRVLSDANQFFIETILEHHRIRECFSEINTNPGYVDGEGRLRIRPYHDFHTAPHGCSLPTCPPNMCKGKVIDRIRAEALAAGKKRVIYLGDGNGDYCPARHLAKTDFMMPRKGFPVWNRIQEQPELISAEIHEWTDGRQLADTLLGLVERSAVTDLSEGFKIESIPRPMPEGRPLALKVPN